MLKQSLIKSFQNVKQEVMALKQNVSEWFFFYNKKHNDHEKRLEILEQRIIFLERKELQKRW